MELKNTPYRVESLKRVILYKLYVEHVNDNTKTRYSMDDIIGLFSVTVSRNLVKSALEQGRQGYTEKVFVRSIDKASGDYLYSISQQDITDIEDDLQVRDSDITYYASHGDESLEEVAGINGFFQTDSGRLAQNTWTELSIDSSNPSYIRAVNALEAAIKTIRDDNKFAYDFPSQRDGLLETLQSGLNNLQGKKTTKHKILSDVLKPLRSFIGFVGKSAAGVIVHDAVTALVTWLSEF